MSSLRSTVVKRPSKFVGTNEVSSFLEAPCIEFGYLQKLNSKGSWQKRFWELRGPYLMYWETEKKSKPKQRGSVKAGVVAKVAPPLAAIDLRRIADLDVTSKSSLTLKSHSNREYKLKTIGTEPIAKWAHAIRPVIPQVEASSSESVPKTGPSVELTSGADVPSIPEESASVSSSTTPTIVTPPAQPTAAAAAPEEVVFGGVGVNPLDDTVEEREATKQSIQRLLDQLKQDHGAVKELMEIIPDEQLRHKLETPEFKQSCDQQFDEIDTDKNGVLTPDELYTVVQDLVGEAEVVVTLEHCKEFAAVFDHDGNGVISKNEFADFIKTLTVVSFLIDQQQQKMDELEFEGLALDGMLEQLKNDKDAVANMLLTMPPDMAAHFHAASFEASCGDAFDRIDADGNGHLTPEELFPIIQNLSGVGHMAITPEHCKQFAEIFDRDGNGVITRDEFADFTRTMMVVQFMLEQQALREKHMQEQQAVDFLLQELREDHLTTADLLKSLPSELVERFNEAAFLASCGDKFDQVDTDKNGVLTPDELYPIILELTSASELAVTMKHCLEFAEIFDADGNGVISRDEFAAFVRTMLVVDYLIQDAELVRQRQLEAEAVSKLLEQLKTDKNFVDETMASLPPNLSKTFNDIASEAAGGSAFDEADADGNGYLTPEELFPVIQSLSGLPADLIHPGHCKQFAAIFDDDGNGVITREEFASFVRTVVVMEYVLSRQMDPTRQALDRLKERFINEKNLLNEMISDMPEELVAEMMNAPFATSCGNAFDQADVEFNGELPASELIPVMQILAAGEDSTLTADMCTKFSSLYENSAGNVTREKFPDLVRTVMVVQFYLAMDMAERKQEAESQALDRMLTQLKENKDLVNKLIVQMPPELAAEFQQASFSAACGDAFDQVDSDENGVLSADELFPIIQSFTGVSVESINFGHCVKLLNAFDHDNNGVITRDEFAAFVRTVLVVEYMIGQEQKAREESQALIAMLGKLKDDRDFVNELIPQLPEEFLAEVNQIASEASCGSAFDQADSDKNGVLTVEELHPVIQNLSGAQGQSITMFHCRLFMEAFDKDADGTLSREEFADFVRTVLIIEHIFAMEQAQKRQAAESEALDRILEQIKEEKDLVNKLMLEMPPNLATEFQAASFEAACGDAFDSADSDKNGVLSVEELLPVIQNLSGAQAESISLEHCKKFMAVFDHDGNGVITRDEFATFVRTVLVIEYAIAVEEKKQQLAAEGNALERIMVELRRDKNVVEDMLSQMPPDMAAQFHQSSFEAACGDGFDSADTDKNGVLSVEELYPVIQNLSGAQAESITLDHCRMFMEVFDTNKDGVISRDEFAAFVRTVMVIEYMLAREEMRLHQAAESEDLDRILAQLKEDKGVVDQLMTQMPVEMATEFTQASFEAACGDAFDEADSDKNGVLSVEELHPVIQNLSGAQAGSISLDHCAKFLNAFDDDGNGVISRDEFARFVRTVMVIEYAIAMEEKKKQMDLEGMALDEMIKQLKEDRVAVQALITQLPADVAAQIQNASFAAACGDSFDQMDATKKGYLAPDELYPVILQLSGASEDSISLEHCKQFAAIFDDDGNGVITRDEFAAFMRTIMVVDYVMAQQQAEDNKEAEGEALDRMLSQLRQDKHLVTDLLERMPADLAREFTQASFTAACGDAFTQADTDGNGVLTPDELFPVIQNLSGANAISVTMDHCKQFAEIFDADGNGAISRDEFAEFVRTVMVIEYLIATEEAKEKQALELVQLDDLIEQLREDKHAVNQLLLQMPTELASQFQAASFNAACGDSFDEIDSDKNGVLSPNELYPIIQRLAGGENTSITEEHCQKIAEIFDNDKNGVISRDEFAEFVRTMMVVDYIVTAQEQSQQQQQQQGMQQQSSGPLLATTQSSPQTEAMVISQMLERIRDDRDAVNEYMLQLPPDLVSQFHMASFADACGESFDEIDTDGNGVLSPDELYPVISQLSGVSDFSVTLEHCKEFAKIFDRDGNGVISRDEFAEFTKTMMVIGYILSQPAHLEKDDMRYRATSISEAVMESKSKLAVVRPEKTERPESGINEPTNQPLFSGGVFGKERLTRRRTSVTARVCYAENCSVLHRRDSPFCHEHAHMDPTRQAVRDAANAEEEKVNLEIELALDHVKLPSNATALGEDVLRGLPGDLREHFDAIEAYQLRQQFTLLCAGNPKNVIGVKEVLKAAEEIGDLMDEDKVNEDWAEQLIAEALPTRGSTPEIDFISYCRAVAEVRQGYDQDKSHIEDRATRLSTHQAVEEWAGKQASGETAFIALRDARVKKHNLPGLTGFMLKRGDAMAVGKLNSWKVRYFRQEKNELVYYEEKPAANVMAEESVVTASTGVLKLQAEVSGAEIEIPKEKVTDDNLKGSINLGEVVHIDISLKTTVPAITGKTYLAAVQNTHITEVDESAVPALYVFKVTNRKMRRFVLAVPQNQIVQWVASFEKHVEYSQASLNFRRHFGSGVPQGLTLEERIEIAKQTPAGQVALKFAQATYENQSMKHFMNAAGQTQIIPGTGITGNSIAKGYKGAKRAMDVLTRVQYSTFEATFGVKWQYKSDVKECPCCGVKFPSSTFRKDRAKHHCRMCGRVVCHACSSTMLHYAASGQRERTCKDCIKNGGPPEDCKIDPETHVSGTDILKAEATSQLKSAVKSEARSQMG